MIQSYVSTGYYVHDCANGVQAPITGMAVYTGFFNQCASDGQAYYLAIANALLLRESNPCLSDPTGTTTTTTTSTTTVPPSSISASGNIFYSWTGDFAGENDEYYDVVAWGSTEGYLSGYKFNTNQYFSQIAANDLNGYGTVLAVMYGSGKVTGFGSNLTNLLDIPSGLTGVKEVSIGYDHCIALLNDNSVTGWGRDNYGVLNIHATLPRNVRRVRAGIGSSVFLLASGIVTGTQSIGGGTSSNYLPSGQSGALNIDYYLGHILVVTSGGQLTGFGQNLFGESSIQTPQGVSRICAGIYKNTILHNDGDVSGYGTYISTIPSDIGQSGKDITFRNQVGTVLYKDQDISQWFYPSTFSTQAAPSYLNNNVVAIAQGGKFTAAIFKRPCATGSPVITGYNYLWKVTGLGISETTTYGGISVDDLYPPLGTVTQTCNCYTFSLPQISTSGTSYTKNNVPLCNLNGDHDIHFVSIRSQSPLLNINYTVTGYAPKTGFAATGITTGDYWNPRQSGDMSYKPYYFSDYTLSTISGGFFEITSGIGGSFSHADSMYSTVISGSGGYPMVMWFHGFPSGLYSGYFYGHGPTAAQNSKFLVSINGDIIINDYTTSTSDFSSTIFSGGNQYLSASFYIDKTGDYVFVICSGSLNGIQFVKL